MIYMTYYHRHHHQIDKLVPYHHNPLCQCFALFTTPYCYLRDMFCCVSGFRCVMDGLGASPRTMSVEDAHRAKHNGRRGTPSSSSTNSGSKSGSGEEEGHEEL